MDETAKAIAEARAAAKPDKKLTAAEKTERDKSFGGRGPGGDNASARRPTGPTVAPTKRNKSGES